MTFASPLVRVLSQRPDLAAHVDDDPKGKAGSLMVPLSTRPNLISIVTNSPALLWLQFGRAPKTNRRS